MEKREVRIEPPRPLGEEIEFFPQRTRPCDTACSAHIHAAVELLYVKSGSYTVRLEEERLEIGEGDLILFPSNAMHTVFAGDAPLNLYYVIKLPPDLLFQLAPREIAVQEVMRLALFRREEKHLWRRDELAGSRLASLLSELIATLPAKSPLDEMALRLAVASLLVELLRRMPPRPPAERTAAEVTYRTLLYLHAHFAEDMDERALARRAGVSYSHFTRCFKSAVGMTFRQYLNVTRIKEAERLLSVGRLTVSEVAAACGYNSVSYFISLFRSVTGETPHRFSRSTKM